MKTEYDFSEALLVATPSELSIELKDKALRLAVLEDNTAIITEMQCAVLNVCLFLDAIIEKNTEQ